MTRCFLLLIAATTAAHAGHRSERWANAVTTDETIEKSFTVSSSGGAAFDLDNYYGSIEVIGTSGNQIQVKVAKTIRAASQADLEMAKSEVVLDVTQDGDSVKLYVGGPFRCYDDYPDCWRRQKERRYVVHMDFQVRVPERIALRLATVNEGRVSVENVTGSFKVNNVNGDVTMRNVGGSGEAKTVNGPVKVSFRENPRETSEFTTVNGDIELVFAKRPDADFHFKTWNGDVTSDFPMTALPAEPAVGERKDGRFVYRSERYTGGRCGSGGPDVTIQNLNGDIRILESGS